MCDTLVVARDNEVWFAKNSDRDPNEAQRLDWLPAREHPEGTELRCTWRTIPQARRTHALVISRPFWMWGAEMGSNEYGVTIGNEAVFGKGKLEDTGLTGMDLVRLGLERAASAAEAVEVIVTLLREFGQGGRCGYSQPGFRYHNSFLVADPHQAFVLETLGRDSACERVAGVRAISNGLTLASLLPRADAIRGRVAQCRQRRARAEQLAAKATRIEQLAGVLRDHGEGNQQPVFSRLNGAMGAPCMHYGGLLAGSQTVASWIARLSPAGPQHWVTGTSAPCLGLFRPIDLQQPAPAGSPQGQPDGASLWWRFETLHRHWLKTGQRPDLATRDQLEAAAFQSPQAWPAHWQAADNWLSTQRQALDLNLPAQAPGWLLRRWREVETECRTGNRLPPVG